jgi:hypothetical protein
MYSLNSRDNGVNHTTVNDVISLELSVIIPDGAIAGKFFWESSPSGTAAYIYEKSIHPSTMMAQRLFVFFSWHVN